MTRPSYLARHRLLLEDYPQHGLERAVLRATYPAKCRSMRAMPLEASQLFQADQLRMPAVPLAMACWSSTMPRPKRRKSMLFSICRQTNGRNNSKRWRSKLSHHYLIALVLTMICSAMPVPFGRGRGKPINVPDHPPPPGYLCYRCREKGTL